MEAVVYTGSGSLFEAAAAHIHATGAFDDRDSGVYPVPVLVETSSLPACQYSGGTCPTRPCSCERVEFGGRVELVLVRVTRHGAGRVALSRP